MLPRNHQTKRMLSHQLPIDSIIVSREDRDESVVYIFPLGFEIHANKKGVCFVGTSTYFSEVQIPTLHRVIRWATKISQEIRDGHGIVPQDELTGLIRLRTKGDIAWYSRFYKVKGSIAEVRKRYNETKRG